MASGWASEQPREIFTIFNGIEIRYYMSPESLAQAIADGYAAEPRSEVKCYVPVELADDQVDRDLQVVVRTKPPVPSPYQYARPTTNQPSVAQTTANRAIEKANKAQRKKFKDIVLADIYKALRRTP